MFYIIYSKEKNNSLEEKIISLEEKIIFTKL